MGRGQRLIRIMREKERKESTRCPQWPQRLLEDQSHFYKCFMSQSRIRQWQPIPVLLPGKSHGRRSLVGCSPCVGHDWATSLSLSLSCVGEENGNPLQCSCLEYPRDRGACWAAICGVTQSRTRLKWLSSSGSSMSQSAFELKWF